MHDVADQISSTRSVERQQREQAAAQASAEAAYDLATQRYRAGLGDLPHRAQRRDQRARAAAPRADLRARALDVADAARSRARRRLRRRAPRGTPTPRRPELALAALDDPVPTNPGDPVSLAAQTRIRRASRTVAAVAAPQSASQPPPTAAPARPAPRRRPRRPASRARSARSRCSASPAPCCSAGIAYGVYYGSGAQPLREHRQRLRAGQRRAADAAGRAAPSSRSTPTTPTSSRPASRWSSSTRPTRRSRSSRPRRSWRRRCARCARCTPTTARCKAQIAAREADLARAQSDVPRAQDDVARRAPLVAHRRGRPGGVQPRHGAARRREERSRRGAVGADAAREQLASNQSLTEGIAGRAAPERAARRGAGARGLPGAAPRRAASRRSTATSRKRSVQLGQRVQAGAPLMSVVALDEVWVDANFKEGQLRNLRIGQPVDARGRRLRQARSTYHGTVDGLGAGTGAAFALLPAQNATGNWIKVVQRVPVRIALDAEGGRRAPAARRPVDGREGRRQPTRTAACSPTRRSAPARGADAASSTQATSGADAEVRRIIAANLGAARQRREARRAAAAPRPRRRVAARQPRRRRAPALAASRRDALIAATRRRAPRRAPAHRPAAPAPPAHRRRCRAPSSCSARSRCRSRPS